MSDVDQKAESQPSKPIVVNGIGIDDTFAEAFGMSATGLIITADTMKWAR